MKVSFDFSQLSRERDHTRQIPARMRRGIWVRVREAAFNAERYVKLAMPVDTGRARASWGHSAPPASPADGIWIEDERSLSITEGSAVEYIENLNEGSSRQAPAGFLDAIARRATTELEDKIADDMARLV